jgi:molecular chaperone DnaK (HSP70)
MKDRRETSSPGDRPPSRFVVGIDLGTTNSAMAYVDTSAEPWRVETFAVPQLVAPGQVEAREVLPSFHYQPAGGELPAGALRLPWSNAEPGHTVGFFARDHGALVPGRLIASAKSWLCHGGVDRTADLLPWQGAEDVDRLSPVEVSARYLRHLREAWDDRMADAPLAQQDLVLTLPASFDEVARELTIKAAARAGLPRVLLIEEPQAAFYAWIDAHAADWEQRVSPGQKILVCDIGGGTSDFTLIRVRRSEGEGQRIQFHRVAVGEHLILGGDNLDLALAQHIERRLKGDGRLEPRQWGVLVRLCRHVKETLLGPAAPEKMTISLPGAGAKLIGGALQIEVTRDEARRVLVEGFFPLVGLDEKPQARRSGFQEFGLPYAPDPAVTRYLAAFLVAHRHAGEVCHSERSEESQHVAGGDTAAETLRFAQSDGHLTHGDPDSARPDIVLFNGGVFESPALRQRMIEAITAWFRNDGPAWQPIVLENHRLDLAVAHGAAYYGLVCRGHGVRIAAGLARTYYVGVESEPPAAVCLAPAGAEPGQDIELPRTFDLQVSQPVEFPLYVSSTRLTDVPGEVIPFDREQMTPLPPIRTVLRTGKKDPAERVPVRLHTRLTEIGTLDMWCSEVGHVGESLRDSQDRTRSMPATCRTWRLQFDVRTATQTDVAAHEGAAETLGFIEEESWERCRVAIADTFGQAATAKPEGLVKRLSEALGMDRRDWPPSLLRRIWEELLAHERGRRRSQVHEARWLNLLGFALRPGYGLAVDDWRVAETWRVLQGRLIHGGGLCRNEWWILWRRIAGGLQAGWQQALADPLLGPVRELHRKLTTGKGKGDASLATHESAEMWRLLGSLELLPVRLKTELGEMVLDLLPKPSVERLRSALSWTLARLGARVPVYGPLNTVVPGQAASAWLTRLIGLDLGEPLGRLAVMQLARRTDDRYRDLPEAQRERAATWLRGHDAPRHFVQLVEEGSRLDSEEQGLVFGEALPKGLRLA